MTGAKRQIKGRNVSNRQRVPERLTPNRRITIKGIVSNQYGSAQYLAGYC